MSSWSDLIERGIGGFEGLLVVEGHPNAFLTGGLAFPSLPSWVGSLPTQLKHTLDRDSVRWGFGTDPRTGDPKMPGCAFVLHDIPGAGVKHSISALMTGTGAALSANLRDDVSASDTTITVDSTSGWPSSGILVLEKETISYTGTTGTTFTGCSRGRYGSKAVRHIYAPMTAASNDLGLEPVVYDRPVTWIGCKVSLYLGAIDTSQTLLIPQRVWRGRIKSAPRNSGTTWTVACESIWDSLDTEILSMVAEPVVRGIHLWDPGVEWYYHCPPGVVGAQDEAGGFDVEIYYDSIDELLEDMTDRLNADLASFAILSGQRFVFELSNQGELRAYQITGINTANGNVDVTFRGMSMRHIFGATSITIPPRVPANLLAQWQGPAPPGVLIPLNTQLGYTDVHVESTENLNAFESFGETTLRTIVQIGDLLFWLHSIDGAAGTIRIQPLPYEILLSDYTMYAITAGIGERLTARLGLSIEGSIPDIWQAFLEDDNIPEEWRGGVHTDDFDWDDMGEYVVGGDAYVRWHVITEPVSLRKRILEDMRFAGLCATVNSEGDCTWRPLTVPVSSFSVGTIDETIAYADKEPTVTPTDQRVVTAVSFEAEARIKAQVGWKSRYATRRRSAETASSNSIQVRTGGLATRAFDSVESHALGYASKLFEIFGGDTMIVRQPCTLRAGLLLPMDIVLFSHPNVPNADTGERGVENVPSIVTEVMQKPFAKTGQNKVDVALLYKTEQSRRAIVAPSARVTAYTDNGAGAGDQRHQLTVSALTYNPVDVTAGSWFQAGMKVQMIEFNDAALPRIAQLTVSPAGHNAAGTAVYITTAPGYTIVAERWVLTLSNYGRASQIAAAKEFAHICDETDGLLESTGDAGFKPT